MRIRCRQNAPERKMHVASKSYSFCFSFRWGFRFAARVCSLCKPIEADRSKVAWRDAPSRSGKVRKPIEAAHAGKSKQIETAHMSQSSQIHQPGQIEAAYAGQSKQIEAHEPIEPDRAAWADRGSPCRPSEADRGSPHAPIETDRAAWADRVAQVAQVQLRRFRDFSETPRESRY